MEHKISRRRLVSLACCIIIGATIYTLALQSYSSLPSIYRVTTGEQINLAEILPRQISASIGGSRVNPPGLAGLKSGMPLAVEPGRFRLDLRLFGLLPLKQITLQVVPPVKVMVGGQSIGVLLHSQGVLVVGFAGIKEMGGGSPARDAGIEAGDLILKVEDTVVQSDAQVSYLIDRLARRKQELTLLVQHRGVRKSYRVRPIYCSETRRYRIGLYIRDGAAGVGTLTFFDPKTMKYGALGHMITNNDNDQSLDLKDGKIVGALIQDVLRGERGRIGEKVGLFYSNQKTTGGIVKNTRYGIFGRLNEALDNPLYPKPLSVAMRYQIRPGPAELLTVIKGDQLQSFKVQIERVFNQPKADGKSFVIRITDPELLKKAGGIVQGMSGSPIIQQGRLVGAVTHVFINDPTRGYGVLAELMLEEAGLLDGKTGESPGFLMSVKAV